MHLKNFLSATLLSLIFVFLPSCIKYHKICKDEFPQGNDLPDKRDQINHNLKTKAIYDEFSTKAIFDVMYQSDEVRDAYVDRNCRKRGKILSEKNALLQSELEKNKHWTSFYVLADVRDKTHISLTDQNSLWSFYIKTESGQNIIPISIKEVEIEPEYQYFFAYRFNLFKRSYHIKFPATDLSGKRYFNKGDSFKLVISSAFKDAEIEWNDQEEVTVKEEYYVENMIEGKKHNWKNKISKKEKQTRFKKIKRPKKKEEKILKDEDFYWI